MTALDARRGSAGLLDLALGLLGVAFLAIGAWLVATGTEGQQVLGIVVGGVLGVSCGMALLVRHTSRQEVDFARAVLEAPTAALGREPPPAPRPVGPAILLGLAPVDLQIQLFLTALVVVGLPIWALTGWEPRILFLALILGAAVTMVALVRATLLWSLARSGAPVHGEVVSIERAEDAQFATSVLVRYRYVVGGRSYDGERLSGRSGIIQAFGPGDRIWLVVSNRDPSRSIAWRIDDAP